MTDPLAQVVGLLRPDLSYSKLIEGAGAWRVRRAEDGRPFFCAVLDGGFRLDVQGHGVLAMQAGDFVLIPAAADFVSSSIVPPPPSDPDSLPSEVRPDVFRVGDRQADADVRLLLGYCAFGSPDAALLVTLLPRLVHVRGAARLTTLVQLAVDEFRAGRPARNVVLARLMEVLLIETLRGAGAQASSGLLRGLADERVAAAIRRMHDSPTAAWTIDALAREAAMSRSAFFDRFRRAVGTTPMDYLLGWRMALAKDMLRRDGGRIADVARRIGYGSASTFSTAFTRHVGVPPGAYGRGALGEAGTQGLAEAISPPARSRFVVRR